MTDKNKETPGAGTPRESRWEPTPKQRAAIAWRGEKKRQCEAVTSELLYFLATRVASVVEIFRNRKS
ncbi:hypothetical protein [Corynebacterium striatum]|uniref:hypothetical protein n=1 Tax=Corynebacterium striatum TaxID=43770 RepID=UPI0027BA1261|nr:hypothetical protein [Corynebacterium striatum]